MIAISIAKAKVSVNKKKRDKDTLISEILSKIRQPKDGRDAPSLGDIVDKVVPLLPEPKVIEAKVDMAEVQAMVDKAFSSRPYEKPPEAKTKVELIREEIDPKKLEGFVTKKDFDKALKRIQAALQQTGGGGGGVTSSIRGAIAAMVNDANYDTMIDTVGLDTYIGKAAPASLTSDSLWQIKKVTDLGGGDTSIRFADGTASFDKIWDNRLTYGY